MTDGGSYTLPHDLPGESKRLTLMSDAFWSWQNSYVTSIGRKPVA